MTRQQKQDLRAMAALRDAPDPWLVSPPRRGEKGGE